MRGASRRELGVEDYLVPPIGCCGVYFGLFVDLRALDDQQELARQKLASERPHVPKAGPTSAAGRAG
jgi:hypothetical protein